MLTRRKFKISFLFGLLLSKGTTEVTFALPGNELYLVLIITPFSNCEAKKSEVSFTNLGGIVSIPTALLQLYFEGCL